MTRGLIADLDEYKKIIDNYLSSMETQFDFARDEIQDLIDRLQISDETSNFLESLIDNPNIPKDIQDKASELWVKI